MGDELRKQPGMGPRTFSSAVGFQALREIRIDRLRIGSTAWNHRPRCFVAAASDHGLDYDGLLGLAQLGFKRAYLDFESNCLRWER